MTILSILTFVISLLSLLVSYMVFQSNDRPKVIIYAVMNEDAKSLINLIVENVGNSSAYNVSFTSNGIIPKQAFGISRLNSPVESFDSSIFKHGIKVFNSKQKFIFEWGQFGGLLEALNNQELNINAHYKYKFPLAFWESQLIDKSIIDIRELSDLPIGIGGNRGELEKIGKELKRIGNVLEKNEKVLRKISFTNATMKSNKSDVHPDITASESTNDYKVESKNNYISRFLKKIKP